MKIDMKIANPAGNITIYVMNDIDKSDFKDVAYKLLNISRFKAEQVAFLKKPIMDGNGRIEMMGGEFCGNAARSFGYLLSADSKEKPSKVKVEISGANKSLEVTVDLKNGKSEIEMPLPQEFAVISYENEKFDLIIFEGIIHIIVPGEKRSDVFVKGLFEKAKVLFPSDAYGIMFLDGDNMIPVVYVCNTDSTIWESSCGSGSTAVGAYKALTSAKGIFIGSIHQPGGDIELTAVSKDKKIISCRMGGTVSLSKKISIEI